MSATTKPVVPLNEEFDERYRRLAVLGQGGMGEVLLSRDARIGREVAMKVVRPRAGGGGGTTDQQQHQQRFLREARVQGQLEHPAIVPVYDLARDGTGTPYFTMKRVNGRTLEDILDALTGGDHDAESRFGRRKLLAAFTQVCLAVDYAHARGILHRDLKPANIMLGDFGEVYLLDWGLARVGAGDPAERTSQSEVALGSTQPVGASPTESGSIMGTPGYMSPEQARGLIEELDGRSDVYGLGSILFEVLTLKPLHRGQTVSAILAETLRGVDAGARARAPERDIAPELEAVCVKATALDPQDRFGSARDLCGAVERYLDGDRDLALRRELADGHARAAHAAAERALANDLEARKLALREVGRALALDPEHAGALRELSRLLARPPSTMPEAAAAEIHALERLGQKRAAMVGFYCYASYFAYLPLGLWMGIANLWAFLIPAPLWIAAALLSLRVAYRPHPQGKMPFPLIVTSSLAVSSMALVFGPLILLPSVAVVNTIAFMMNRDRTRRPFILACGVFAVLLPLALENAGVLPVSYAFGDDTLMVFANAVHFPPVATRAFLLVTTLGVIVVSAILIARMRDLLTAKEQQTFLHSWQLRQLVPEDASGPVELPLPSDPACPIMPPR